MINPEDIIRYNRTTEEEQELILFLIAVAGKNANTTSRLLHNLLTSIKGDTPFDKINKLAKKGQENFKEVLKSIGFGCHTRLARAFTEVASSGIDLKTCTLEDLMEVHGIGRKSASCYLAWTRKGVKVAMLDTHLLKFIRDYIGYKDAPKATPSSKKQYEKWEKIYLDYCDAKNVDPTEYDLKIWVKYSTKADVRL